MTRTEKERLLLLKREKVKRKCEASFVYWLENYAWIEDKVNGGSLKFVLWESQQEIMPDFLTAMRLLILKARQLGLTWLCAAYALWICIFKPLQFVVVISAKEEWAIEFIERVTFILANLPPWLAPALKKQTTQSIVFKHKGGFVSEIKSLSTTPEGAQGKTPTLLILDETAVNRYISKIYASSKPGIDAAKGRIIMISNSIKDAPGWSFTRDIFVNSMKGDNDFVRIFMPWKARPDRPADFKARQIREGMEPEDFQQHYPETEAEAVSNLLSSYFGQSLARHDSTRNGVTGRTGLNEDGVLDFIENKKGILEVWRYPYQAKEDYDGLEWTNRYAIGSDVSEGLGQSFSVAYVKDRLTDQYIARLRSNRVDAHEWGRMLHELSQYYDDALICTESTGAGQTTIKYLSDVGANQYLRVIPTQAGQPVTHTIGWHESQQAKHELSGDLKTYFKNTTATIYCALLMEESGTWIKHDNGKIGPEGGKLGDCVIGAGLTEQADIFQGDKPKKAKEPVKGWRKRIYEEGKSNWAK